GPITTVVRSSTLTPCKGPGMCGNFYSVDDAVETIAGRLVDLLARLGLQSAYFAAGLTMNDSNPTPLSSALTTLQEVFGYPAFRGAQGEIIDHLIAGGDAPVLMPTGGGKS